MQIVVNFYSWSVKSTLLASIFSLSFNEGGYLDVGNLALMHSLFLNVFAVFGRLTVSHYFHRDVVVEGAILVDAKDSFLHWINGFI